MLFFKMDDNHPTLRHIDLIAEKRQQLPLQCCISPHTDEQQQRIHSAMLFFLCWQHHNFAPKSPKGILGAASAAEKNNKRVTFPPFLYLLKASLLVLKEPGTKGPGCIAICSLLPPTPHHSVCTAWKKQA